MDLPVFFFLLRRRIQALVPAGRALQLGIFPVRADQGKLTLLCDAIFNGRLLLSAHGSLLHPFTRLALLLASQLWVQVQEVETVLQDLMFHLMIKFRLRGKGGRMVHLQQPRLQLLIQHHVETQDLKAHAVVDIFWLATVVKVGQAWLHCNQCLDDQILNLQDEGVHIVPLASQMLLDRLPTSLVTVFGIIWIGVLLEIGIRFVDGVVGQVHHHFRQVVFCWFHILLRCQTHEALPVQEDPQGIAATDEDIETKIKLVAVQQQGFANVPLSHEGGRKIHGDLLNVADQEDSFPLTAIVRFDDEGLLFYICKLLFKIRHVGRQDPSVREEAVFLGKLLPQS
mmetsp:Transcript_25336/g.41285  ORF Transcript_25336/g.41285 Transcript_25336/m.41285 type:complete len:340 (-) Transcript_25336:376-1395(-)